jgi:Tfp pilus assembly protein PilF
LKRAISFTVARTIRLPSEHLAKALATYPEYVAAHNTLGFSYLGLDRNDEAREQFAKAAVLDPHLPLAFLNLAYAESALHRYSAAQVAAQKVSAIAPLDRKCLRCSPTRS